MTTSERLRDATSRVVTGNQQVQTELGEYGFLIDGHSHQAADAIEVRSPYDDALVAIVHRAGPAAIEQAIRAEVERAAFTFQIAAEEARRIYDIHAASKAVDASEFGLQAGLFTNDWRLVEDAFDQIEVGGLIAH